MSRRARSRPPRRNGRDRGLRWLLAAVVAAALVALGVAVGEALHDNPRPGVTTTNVTTVAP